MQVWRADRFATQVNCTAAVVLSTIGMLFEGAAPWGAGREGVFGYFNKARCEAVRRSCHDARLDWLTHAAPGTP